MIGFIAAAFLAGWIAAALLRRRAAPAAGEPPPPRQSVEPVTPAAREQLPPLSAEVGEALRSDAANDGMLSVVRADPDAGLSELELDLADWGFTYGVAWARARERAPAEGDEAWAREALTAAERVFQAYQDGTDWTQRAVEDSSNGHGHTGPE